MTYAAEGGAIRLALTGDSLIARKMRPYLEREYLAVRDLLHSADARITNAEMLFHDFEDPPTLAPGGSYLGASPDTLAELEWFGVNMVCAANNHNYDFGEAGLLTHLNNLKSSRLPFAGIGRSLDEAQAPTYLDTANGRVALVAVTFSGPQGMIASQPSKNVGARPGSNLLRYTTEYTVESETFEAFRRFRDELDLVGQGRRGDNLRHLDHSYGMSDVPDDDDSFYMADLKDHWQYPVPNGCRFVRGAKYAKRLVPVHGDLELNLDSIRDARRMADWVVVSIHSHEAEDSLDEPTEMLQTFARAAIDAGADVVHGHGPHRDRGIEIYAGRPIFYSIGHFIIHNDTVQHVPGENMIRQGLDPWSNGPADFYDARAGAESEGEFLGKADAPGYWRDFVALVDFDGGRLSGVTLHPIDLGLRRPRYMRGRPVIAGAEVGEAVLDHMDQLSKPFGTVIERRDGLGHIRL